jgi:hypothetical protein
MSIKWLLRAVKSLNIQKVSTKSFYPYRKKVVITKIINTILNCWCIDHPTNVNNK